MGSRRSPSIITRAIVFLLLGAIVNVAVAWGLSLLIDPFSIGAATAAPGFGVAWDRQGGRNSGDVFWFACEVSNGGAARLSTTARKANEFDVDFGEDPRDILPHWWIPDGLPAGEAEQVQAAAEARGWPMLSMWYHVRYWDHVGGRGRMQSPGGIDLPLPVWRDPMPFSSYDQPRTLPLRVIWPGFAINTLFYAGMLWLLFAAPFALRHRSRIKRGLCPACAYPIGESNVCTECGKPVRSKEIAA
jgi:hypothetical protein